MYRVWETDNKTVSRKISSK